MKYFVILILINIFCQSVVCDLDSSLQDDDYEYIYENDVVVIDEGNIERAKQKFEYLFLEFYAPWCGHCQKLAPELEKAAKVLKEEGIVIGKCDASVHRKLADKEGVNGYPTLKFVVKGREIKFDGGRTSDAIQQWIWSQINEASEQMDTIEQIEDAREEHNIIFFYFADGEVDGKDRDFRRYKDFSQTVRETKFGHTNNPKLRSFFKIPKFANFIAIKQHDQKIVSYTSDKLRIQEMKTFVELNKLPRILTFESNGDFIEEKVFKKEKPAVLLFSNGNANENDQFKQGALDYPYEEYLLFIKVTDFYRDQVLDRLQIKDSDANGLFIISKNGTLKHQQNQPVTKDSVISFVNDWKDGKAKRYLKSSDIQQVQIGPVKTLVGETYYQLTEESNKDIIIFYYDSKNEEHAPVEKQFDQVAQRLLKNNLIFAKLDLSQNEVQDMQESLEVVKVRIYKGEKGDRDFVKFRLNANKIQEERLVKWIRENSRQEINDPKGDL